MAYDNGGLQYTGVGYNYGRYILPNYLMMYEVTKDRLYLDRFTSRVNMLFRTNDYFRDVSYNALPSTNDPTGANGHSDGYRGWGNRGRGFNRRGLPIAIIPGIDHWYHVKLRVTDEYTLGSLDGHRIQCWVNDTLRYSELYRPNRTLPSPLTEIGQLMSGNPTLLSGWSQSRFRNVVVRTLSGANWVDFYNLNNSLSTFQTDWKRVEVPSHPDYTGTWQLIGSEIQCNDAVDDPPFISPPSALAKGKYAALILTKSRADTLLNCEIDYEVSIEKRMNSQAESGAALRYTVYSGSISDGNTFTTVPHDDFVSPDQSERSFFISPGEGPGEELLTDFPYVKTNARYIVAKLHPHDQLQVALHGRFVSGKDKKGNLIWNDSWWVAPWEEDPQNDPSENGFYNEGANPDGVLGETIARFAEIVFADPELRDTFGYGNIARSYLTTYEENLIRKWESVWNRDNQYSDFRYGDGRFYIGFEGWKEGLFWSGWLGRLGAMFGPLWRATQSGYWNTSQFQNFYYQNYLYMSQEMPQHADIQNEGYLWNDYRGFIGSYVSGYSDLGHSGALVRMIVDAGQDAQHTLITPSILQTLTNAFTNRIWNGQVGSNCRVWKYVNGNNTELAGPGSVMFDGWIQLAKIDFKVWEIFDEYGTSNLGMMDAAWNIHEAEMLYTVRYGIPKNLRLDTIRTCNGNAYILRWQPPSDYPIGLNGSAGTRLQFYNIYRSERPIGGGQWSIPVLVHQIDIQSFQAANPYPFWFDDQASQDITKEYSYFVRTQDWSVGITNESFNSNSVTVQYNNIHVTIPTNFVINTL